jgi:hypothetical protein
MTRARALAVLTLPLLGAPLAFVGRASAKPGARAAAQASPAKTLPSKAPSAKASAHTAPPPHVVYRPAPPLPMLPSLARVRVEAARDRVVVIEDVNLPRGDWQSGGLDLYVAFGAPGTPVAVDARLVSVATGAVEARVEDTGDPVTVEPAVRHTPSTQLLLGRPTMAGVAIHVKESDLRRAYAASDLAALRVRSLLEPPSADTQGARDVVVRLGIIGALPLTLGRVQVVSAEPQPWITGAEAHLCGPDADPSPLAVTLVPRPASASTSPPPIAPAMAVRHASDDLCVRWWAAP